MKELQGQFKTDFEKWLISHEINQDVFEIDSINGYFSGDLYYVFYRLPICAQFGVYEMYADTTKFNLIDWYLEAYGKFLTVEEAQQEAITQFEKWYNEQR